MGLTTDSEANIEIMPGVVQPVGIIGLGYVGLQLAAAFGRRVPTVGFDIDARRVDELLAGSDRSGEVDGPTLQSARFLSLTADPGDLPALAVYIVAVPTPVDGAKRPDLRPLLAASELVGAALAHGSRTAGGREALSESKGGVPLVVYESTVYPGCTEEVCVPALARASGLRPGIEFKVGYSPERINPGDPEHSLQRVIKIVAGQDAATTDLLADLYGLVVDAGVHRAPNIKTAEAAKVIENVQRDLNIALMNELAILFHRMGLDAREVLAAARTKWNFLPFEPGLVGGHCIPVDPYYLTHKAQELGLHPEVILAGRRTNDSMGLYVAQQTLRLLNQAGRPVRNSRVLIMGAAFKPNVRDLRNTRVADVARELRSHGADVVVYDPLVGDAALAATGLQPIAEPFEPGARYDAVVIAVPHRMFWDSGAFARVLGDSLTPVVVDVPGVLRGQSLPRELLYWRL